MSGQAKAVQCRHFPGLRSAAGAVLFVQSALYSVVHPLHEHLGIQLLVLLGRDGSVYLHAQRALADAVVVARKDVERPIDGYRNNGKTDFPGKHESATLKGIHAPGVRPRALGKYDHRGAAPKSLLRLAHGMDDAGAAFAHENLLAPRTSKPHEGQAAQVFLHHPLKLVGQIAVEQENVEVALMVRKEHIALPRVETFQPFETDRVESRANGEAAPEPWHVPGNIPRVAQKRSHYDQSGNNNGGNDKQRQRHHIGIYLVKNPSHTSLPRHLALLSVITLISGSAPKRNGTRLPTPTLTLSTCAPST